MVGAWRVRRDPRTPKARRLRVEATPFERKLWAALKQIELPQGHFRRQAPIGPYFADFAHHGLRLIIELDGAQHGLDEGLQRDTARTAYLEAAGYRVIRFWNHEIRENLDGVVATILSALADAPLAEAPPTRNPSPPLAARAGGGGCDASRLGEIDREDVGVSTC
jgi:very-short-patch-repair endonuclease